MERTIDHGAVHDGQSGVTFALGPTDAERLASCIRYFGHVQTTNSERARCKRKDLLEKGF